MHVQKPNWWIAETSAWIAVNKPCGLSVEKTVGANDTIEDQVLAYLHKSTAMPFLGIVHRLDRVTSGILLMAKKKSALRKLNEQFSQRLVKKTYLAVVEGVPQQSEALLTQWLYKDQKEKKAIIFDEDGPGRDLCQLHYEIKRQNADQALLEVEIMTGKFHQIRAQLASIGTPIVGDEKYGASRFDYAEMGIALHANTLRFQDPVDGSIVVLRATLPSNQIWDWQ